MKKFHFIIVLVLITISMLGLQSCGEVTTYTLGDNKIADEANTASLNKVWIDSGYVQVDYVSVFGDQANYIVKPDIFSFTLSRKNSSFFEVPQSGNLDSITVYPNNIPLKLGEFANFTNAPGAEYQHIILYFYEIEQTESKSDKSLHYTATIKVWAKK